jgi:hypothetical protein
MTTAAFKPYANNSQQKSLGSDERGEISFTNEDDVLIVEGRLEIPKTAEGLKYLQSMLSTLNDAQQEVLKECGKVLASAEKSSKSSLNKK